MNVFVIPSWYPSIHNPIYGTFVKEQCVLLARNQPDLTIGISLWGQGDDAHLLYVGQPFSSFRKLIKSHSPSRIELEPNLVEYYHPARSWTRRLFAGNIKGILKANLENLLQFEEELGKPDILHAQASYPAAIVARELSSRLEIPFIVTIRMSPFPFGEFLTPGGAIRSLIMDPLRSANRLIATSTSLQNVLRSHGLDQVEVIHNPVDTDFFHPGPASPQIGDRSRMIAIGRLVPQKGFDLLITAFHEVRKTHDVRLTILGEGPERTSLENQIRQLHLDAHVDFQGELSREQVRDQLSAHDVYVLSSRHETFGNVVLEAMATGLPVVATRCGGPQDIVTNETGVFCENEDPADLARAMIDALNKSWDPSTIRAYVEDRFSPKQFSQHTTELYERVIASAKG